MAGLNAAYGSELHLLRMLGRHREHFTRKVCEVTTADDIGWLDFPDGLKRLDAQGHVHWDREWHQLEFLPRSDPARTAWDAAWPSHREGHNWDAIGRARFGPKEEWLLVEAKANIQELRSKCQAGPTSRKRIETSLNVVKMALGVKPDREWTAPYYQYCNRLVALHVLNVAGTPARLLYLYFYGDTEGESRTCPESAAAWEEPLERQHRHVGLPSDHLLRDRIHTLFLDVQRLTSAAKSECPT